MSAREWLVSTHRESYLLHKGIVELLEAYARSQNAELRRALEELGKNAPNDPQIVEAAACAERMREESKCDRPAPEPRAPRDEYTLEDYMNAPSGIGPLAYEWKDKPHRLVYALVRRLRAGAPPAAEPREHCPECECKPEREARAETPQCSVCGKPPDYELHSASAELLACSSFMADDYHPFEQRGAGADAEEIAPEPLEQLVSALKNYRSECPCSSGIDRGRCDYCVEADIALEAAALGQEPGRDGIPKRLRQFP